MSLSGTQYCYVAGTYFMSVGGGSCCCCLALFKVEFQNRPKPNDNGPTDNKRKEKYIISGQTEPRRRQCRTRSACMCDQQLSGHIQYDIAAQWAYPV